MLWQPSHHPSEFCTLLGVEERPLPPHMIVKHFGCTAMHNKALYKCIIHSIHDETVNIGLLYLKYQNVMCNLRMRGEDVIDLNVQKCTICNIYFLFCCSWIIVHYGVAATSAEQTHIRGLIHLVTFLYFIRWCQLSIYLFMHLSVCLSIYLSIYLF